MGTKIVPRKVYLCNQEQCGDRCSYPMCKATLNKEFALDISIPFYIETSTGDLVQRGCFDD